MHKYHILQFTKEDCVSGNRGITWVFGEKGSSNPLLDANTVCFSLFSFYDVMRITRIKSTMKY